MISDFAKEKVFWSRKMNLKLVKFIEGKPHIWNPKHPKYTMVQHRDQTYAEFAAKYGDNFTGQAVKDRWTNIRSTYSHYFRKVSRLSNGEEYKVNWHLWEACQFLTKVNKKNHLANASTDSVDPDEFGQESESDPKRSEEGSEDCLSDNRTSNIKCEDIADNLVNVFKNVQNDPFGLDNTEHGRIGRTVGKTLSKMSSSSAAQVSKQIMDILLLYDENNPENPNNLI